MAKKIHSDRRGSFDWINVYLKSSGPRTKSQQFPNGGAITYIIGGNDKQYPDGLVYVNADLDARRRTMHNGDTWLFEGDRILELEIGRDEPTELGYTATVTMKRYRKPVVRRAKRRAK